MLPHEYVARAILPRFPGSTLIVDENQRGSTFDIYYEGKLLLSLNNRGTRYFFPTRRKRVIIWEKISTAGLSRTVDYILRDLAEADYTVLWLTDKPISKRPVHISRYTRCPECKQSGGIKSVAPEDSSLLQASDLYTPIALSPETRGAEIKCTLCGWIGIRGELARKRRFPRS